MYSHTHAIYHGFCVFFCYVVRPPILNKFPLLVSVSYGIINKFAFRLIMQHKKSDRTKANSTRIEHQREHTIEWCTRSSHIWIILRSHSTNVCIPCDCECIHRKYACCDRTQETAQRYAWKWFVPKNNHMSHRYTRRYSVIYGAAFRGHIHF